MIGHRNREARHHNGSRLGAAVAWQHDSHFVAGRHQRLRQRLDHVRKTASLRERQPFRCYKKYSHSLVLARFLGRPSRPSFLGRHRAVDTHFTLLDLVPAVKTEAFREVGYFESSVKWPKKYKQGG